MNDEEGIADEAFWASEPAPPDLWEDAAPCTWNHGDLVRLARSLGGSKRGDAWWMCEHGGKVTAELLEKVREAGQAGVGRKWKEPEDKPVRGYTKADGEAKQACGERCSNPEQVDCTGEGAGEGKRKKKRKQQERGADAMELHVAGEIEVAARALPALSAGEMARKAEAKARRREERRELRLLQRKQEKKEKKKERMEGKT
mmetsp:Transcript_45389/g.96572  ORF Transcript_45389/g.96572 Transcript_45389/m.96572 type:complete len:201 (-) Transcript_45389:250-852(-)